MGKLREIFDSLVLSDHEWKKKYCPFLYHYLFEMTPEEKHAALEDGRKWNKEHRKVCPECHGIHWSEECPECTQGIACGGYEIEVKRQ